MRKVGAKTAEQRRMQGRNEMTGPGSLRIMTGGLRYSLQGPTEENIAEGQFIGSTFRLLFGSKVPYALAHEEGFSGTVNVPEHTRTITQVFGRTIAPTQVTVSAHSKNMKVPKRPYLVPGLDDQTDAITKEITRRVYNLIISL